MDGIFGSDLWHPALDKFSQVTGLSVALYDIDAREVVSTQHPTALVALFREYGFDPGLYAECARLSLNQTEARPAVVVAESHGLTVVGTSLILEGAIVGAAVGGYAFSGFSQVTAIQRLAQSAGVPFDRLWDIARRLAPVPERRLKLNGELFQVLGDALLRENYRTRQYEDVVVELKAAAAAKDEFIAVLSHELRAPLAPISGWASVLKETTSLDLVHKAAHAIDRNARRQARMIDDLLDINRISRGTIVLELARHDVCDPVREAVESSAGEIQTKEIRLEVESPAEALLVEGDAMRLQQIFTNIISNAVKFTPSGGSIRVVLSREEGNACVVVTDTGLGIAPEFLPFVFEMFRQHESGTRREYAGLGIGLALVKRLVELHRGTVSIASAGIGEGAEVTVRLPLAVETLRVRDATPAALHPSLATLAGLSVLVVEDSEDARESLRQQLHLLGMRVSVAHDGREALDLIVSVAPDLILCDLRMPRMDGFEFMREFLLRGPPSLHPPVVAMSGFTSEADRKRTLEAGFEGHIAKPFDVAAIVAAVGEALSHRALH